MNLLFLPTCKAAGCVFDMAATRPIISFEVIVVVGTVLILFLLSRYTTKIILRYGIVALGVLIFEVFTSPLWQNAHMGKWAYLYQDVSWILTLGWSTLILATIIITERVVQKYHPALRFLCSLVVFSGIGIFAESLVVNLGIRSYAPEVVHMLVGRSFLNAPIEALYYIPVFTALIISFYQYWMFALEQRLVVPVRTQSWVRNLVITCITVFLFEIMVEPMVANEHLSTWSYLYRDVSILMTGTWVIVIWMTVGIIDRVCIHFSQGKRFIGYLILGSVLSFPLESWYITHGMRVYLESAQANFSGFVTPISGIPVEVAFAIPFYLALMIASMKYWEMVFDRVEV